MIKTSKLIAIFLTIYYLQYIGATKDRDSCRNFEFNLPDFSIDKFIGIWYPIYKTNILPIYSKCEYLELEKGSDGSMEGEIKERGDIDIVNVDYDLEKTKNPNSFTFTYMAVPGLMTIVDTDYVKYALVYTCSDMLVNKVYNAAILSRTPTLNQSDIDRLLKEAREKLGENDMEMIKQDECDD